MQGLRAVNGKTLTYSENSKMKIVRLCAVLSGLLLLSACAGVGSKDDADVIGIGRGIDDYKVSPCACAEIPQAKPDANDIEALKDWFG